MRWQTTAALAVILLVLGGFYYLYEVRLGPERAKTEARKGQMFTAEPADVTAVEVKRGGEVLKFQREGDGWRMLAPVATRGDRGAIEELLTTVLTAKIDREIAAAPASLAEFGLDPPAADVSLTLKDGKQLAVQLGGKNPTGVWVYARETGKPAVVALPDSVLRDASRPVADYRDKTALAFDRSAVTGIDLLTSEGPVSLEGGGGTWKMTRPAPRAADAEVVGDLLEKLGAARVKEFVVETPASLQSYGLDRPLRIDVHTGRDKDRATRSLLVGRPDEGKQGVYAMRPAESSVFLLPDDVWKALPKSVAALRDKTVAAFDRDKVTRIEVAGPRGAVTLARENGQWRIVAPEALAADQVEVGVLLRKLRELKAQAFLTEDASGIPRYLAKPELRVTLTSEGGVATTVLLTPSPEGRGARPSAYAAVAGSGPLVLVDGAALADLGRTADDLRDRRLLGDLEPKDITRVTIKRGGKSVVLERKGGDQAWQMLEPTKGAAKSGKVDDLLYTARGLRWKDIVAPQGQDAARYGLDAPEMEVTLGRADGREVGTVLVGKREGDRVFVRTKAGPSIYALEARQLGELPNLPDDFKG